MGQCCMCKEQKEANSLAYIVKHRVWLCLVCWQEIIDRHLLQNDSKIVPREVDISTDEADDEGQHYSNTSNEM